MQMMPQGCILEILDDNETQFWVTMRNSCCYCNLTELLFPLTLSSNKLSLSSKWKMEVIPMLVFSLILRKIHVKTISQIIELNTFSSISIIRKPKRHTVIIFTIIIEGKTYYKFQPLVLKNIRILF